MFFRPSVSSSLCLHNCSATCRTYWRLFFWLYDLNSPQCACVLFLPGLGAPCLHCVARRGAALQLIALQHHCLMRFYFLSATASCPSAHKSPLSSHSRRSNRAVRQPVTERTLQPVRAHSTNRISRYRRIGISLAGSQYKFNSIVSAGISSIHLAVEWYKLHKLHFHVVPLPDARPTWALLPPTWHRGVCVCRRSDGSLPPLLLPLCVIFKITTQCTFSTNSKSLNCFVDVMQLLCLLFSLLFLLLLLGCGYLCRRRLAAEKQPVTAFQRFSCSRWVMHCGPTDALYSGVAL